ncbi:putative 3-hydroxylacyl-(acyl carrier protein) dehydratase [Methylophilaceae bacterium 11]|jgi:predicted hotdog family 3-hydroxylacyl-ACP dehydratase|nr:putative 3-hydroxylacyl-(acyl carrier protein) dehydratase [Methylophilaceae bacterium 11]
MKQLKVIPDIADVLLHSGNMRLLDSIVDYDAEFTIAAYTPVLGAWYADQEGNMPAWIGIELMAQAISAHAGLLKYGSTTLPKHGALLGTRSYQAFKPMFVVNQALMIHVTLVYRDISGLGAYDCRIYYQQTLADDSAPNLLAKATLKVFEPDNFQQFLQDHAS